MAQGITNRDYESITASMREIKDNIAKITEDSTEVKIELVKINQKFELIEEKFVTKKSFVNAVRWAVVTAIAMTGTLIAYLNLIKE